MRQEIERVFNLQQAKWPVLARQEAAERIGRLMRIDSYLRNERNLDKLYKAMYRDLHKPEVEVIATEVGVVQAQISYLKKNLKRWMRPRKVPTPLPLIGTRSHIRYEPRGVVLIMSPWNFPLNLSLVPMVYAIAAGNAVMLKPSEISANTSAFIKHMIEELFAEDEVVVFEGDASVAKILLEQPFNHIFFTGSPKVGRIVMTEAARHLSSVTLELGGKSPAIIDASADIDRIARRAAWAKSVNNGQTCITPDYILLHESIRDPFIRAFSDAVKQFYDPQGKGIRHSPDYCRIVSEAHFKRLRNLYEDAVKKGANTLFGGEFEEHDLFISPTLLDGINGNMDIMQEEIFGPLLPVLTYSDREEARDMIRRLPSPLTLYIASRDKGNIDYFIKSIPAGGTVINDYMLGYSNPALPFGGVNNSGIGRSLGLHCFAGFSNERSVIQRRWGTLSLIHPPYNDRVRKIVKTLYRWM
ncbi:MAG: aldehyde dehydrogenase family protein [Methanolobus sp.]|nr:aldehyde dehydrogenase family protein [Methanolobus sp.]